MPASVFEEALGAPVLVVPNGVGCSVDLQSTQALHADVTAVSVADLGAAGVRGSIESFLGAGADELTGLGYPAYVAIGDNPTTGQRSAIAILDVTPVAVEVIVFHQGVDDATLSAEAQAMLRGIAEAI